MGDGTKENPYTREDVLRLIEENGGKAEGLNLSRKVFEKGVDLHGLGRKRIILTGADLSAAHLEGANLRHAHLEGAILKGAHLERADLRRAKAQKAEMSDVQIHESNLERAHLEGADLHRAHLEGANLRHAHLKGAILREAHLERANLRNARLQEARLQRAQLQDADLTRANLQGAYLNEAGLSASTKLVRIYWGDYIIGEEKKRQFLWAADAYRRLKMWYTNAGMYDTAADFYYREMEATRKNAQWRLHTQLKHPKAGKKLWRFIFERRNFGYWLRLWIYRLTCGYGERPWQVVASAAVVVLGLALIYFIIGLTWEWWAFWNSLYFSAVSFTALGYGSWLGMTNDWMRGLGAFESFIGVFTMALFLVTFIRKMIR